MPPALVALHLGEVLPQENVACEPAALNLLARAAAGSMRDALSLTDQAIAYGGGRVEAAAVEAMLGTVRRDYLFDLLDALAAGDGDALLVQARQLAERGIAFDAALQDPGNLLTQLTLILHAPGAVESSMDAERMQAAAAQLDAETVQLYYQIALNGRRDLPYYQWVAARVGGPQYARAVGNALGANPLPIVVPCHRIVAQDATLGGFSGGLPTKRRLLTLEGTLAQLQRGRT